MPSLMKPVRLRLAALLAAATLGGSALAADVELLPAGLLTPTTKEMTKANQYKKAGPWRIGVSFGGVGNTWIVQMIQEMKHAAVRAIAQLGRELGMTIVAEGVETERQFDILAEILHGARPEALIPRLFA